MKRNQNKTQKQIGTLVNTTWKQEVVDNMNNVEKNKNGLIIQLEREENM